VSHPSEGGVEPRRSLRVLVIAHNLPGAVRFVGPVIRCLLDRGHEVRMELEPPARKHRANQWLREMERDERFSWGIVDAWRRDVWFVVARWLRRFDVYVRTLLVGRERIPYLVERAGGRAPRTGRLLVRLPGLSSRRGLRALSATLSALDRAVPVSRRTVRFFRSGGADVVIVVPILMPGSTDSAYLRAARAAGVPSVLCIPSWDNLSSKQLIRVVPDGLTVWNETQRREAMELHGIPPERVIVTGAQCFDHWFEWEPRPRAEFCARVGLAPDRPYLLYAAGAIFPSSITEAEFARSWIIGLRDDADPVLRDVSILVRPHPKRTDEWEQVRFDDLAGVAVWPRGDAEMPVGQAAREDYFDSIRHSAGVVAVNSSAMIESAIIGRPVFTTFVPEFHTSQLGTFHFEYVLDVGGGFVRTSKTVEEQRRQLAQLLRGESDGGLQDGQRFVDSFVRPLGRDRAATPVFADAVERLARAGTAPQREPVWTRPLRAVLVPGLLRVLGRRVRLKVELEVRRLLGREPRAVDA
jgi:hypothetical protein